VKARKRGLITTVETSTPEGIEHQLRHLGQAEAMKAHSPWIPDDY
jgi:hypothetical protein